jgi:hypothetical protein
MLEKMHYEIFIIMFYTILCITSVNLLLNFLKYQNSGKKLKIYFSNITYDVLYHINKVDIKTQLIRGKTKITNHLKG